MKPLTAVTLGLPLFLLASCAPPGERSIRTSDLDRHVRYLASDDLAGRYTGSAGVALAEVYIAGVFRSAGLEPLPGENDYYVDFQAWRQGYDPAATTLSITDPQSDVPAAILGTDFRPFEFTGLGQVDADLVFAGYGITAPEHDWDDYRGLDVRGKVVLLLRYEPGQNDASSVFAGARHTSHAYFATKVRNAQAHGAVGMLLFTTPLGPPQEDLRVWDAWRLDAGELPGPDRGRSRTSFLSLQVSQGYAERIAAAAGTTIRELHRAVDAGTPPSELALPDTRVTASVALYGQPVAVSARNVVGYLRGVREDRVVVVGAHHDHIGSFAAAGDADTIYNGADDNASGVSGVLELAQAFGRSRGKPRTSVIFATFSGEEEYLLGSQALAASPLLATMTVTFMLNLDMIGRNPGDPVEIYGSTDDTELRGMLETSSRAMGLTLEYPGDMPESMSSDHASFQARGVRALFFHTGLHDDYHGLDDEADRLDYPHMERVVRLAWRLIRERAGLR